MSEPIKVYVAVHPGTKRKYHTSESCPHIKRAGKVAESTKESREKLGWEECSWCSGEWHVSEPEGRRPSLQDLIDRGGVETIETTENELYQR